MTYPLTNLLSGNVDPSEVKAISVTGVSADSRSISAGEAFFALPGTSAHGNSYIGNAEARGASVIVTDQAPAAHPGIPVVMVADVRAAFARALARIYAPQPETAVGVTGTNGKTSVTGFVRQLWQASGISGASVGTLGIQVGETLIPGELTTPDPASLHKALSLLKSGGTDHVALEASSHGLDQRRLDGIMFKAVGFTNLGRDHLDYHADIDAYREAKLRLFRDLLAPEGFAVVNTDDPEHLPFMFAALDRGATLLTVGTEGAYFELSGVEREGFGQKVKGRLVGETVEFLLPLTGRFQVDNAIMAVALAIQTGADPEKSVEALSHLKGVKGRMEMVGMHNGAAVFVDYSHKPDALEQALVSLRPYAQGQLSVVFGCGGDRDSGKRPIMGEIAARRADKVVVTDDNPRTENAGAIRKAILAGVPKAIEIADRAEAIGMAMSGLKTGDVLLVAGKGHEEYQIVGTEKRHFSDHEVIAGAMSH